MKKHWISLVLFTLLFVVVFTLALADGTETLELPTGTETLAPPTIPIETGTGMVAAGTGMVTKSGEIAFSVPDDPDDVTIKQVLLYWEGRMNGNVEGDNTIVVNGMEVTGEGIGGPTKFCDTCFTSSFRADITDLELVTPGDNTLTLSGLDFDVISNGAGVLVLYKGSGLDAEFKLFDGVDVAFDEAPERWPEPRKNTVPQTFTFKPSPNERQAKLSMFVSSIIPHDEDRPLIRPSSIEVKIDDGVPQKLSDLLENNNGAEWDTLNLPITIPKNAESLTVQIFSRDDYPEDPDPLRGQNASLVWIAAGLMVLPPDEDAVPDVEVSKTCTPDVFVGDGIDYEITVTNTGGDILKDLELEDSLLDTLPITDTLAVGASTTVTKTMIADAAGVITNTVTVTATGVISAIEVDDTDDCTTNVYELQVTKDAQTSLNKRYKYNWKINKWVKARKEDEFKKSIDLTVFPGQVYYPTYEVEVDLGDPALVDSDWSDWKVSGTISVTNPAPIVASLESVTDVIPDDFVLYLPMIAKNGESQNAGDGQNQVNLITVPGIDAPVSCPSLTVPAGQTLVCTYGPVNLNSGLTRTNTAIATLKNRVGEDFSGTTDFSGTAQIDFTDAVVVVLDPLDEEVTLTDTNNPTGLPITLNVNDVPYSFEYDDVGMPKFTVEECRRILDDPDLEDPEEITKKVPNTACVTKNDSGSSSCSRAMVKLLCIESASTGYEDLPITRNDWDYNDAFFKVSFDTEFSTKNDLKKVTFQFSQPVNISSYTHEFWIKPDVFRCNGTYSLTRNKDHEDKEVITGTYNAGDDLLIITDTGIDDEGPDKDKPNTAELVINFNVQSAGDCPLDLIEFDPFETFNGEDLFYVPRLYVKNTEKWIEPGDPRVVGVPDLWEWPGERIGIWNVYPDVKRPPTSDVEKDPNKRVPTFSPLWWLNYIGP